MGEMDKTPCSNGTRSRLWQLAPVFEVRSAPDSHAAGNGLYLHPGDQVEVVSEKLGPMGELLLELAHGQGWIVSSHPDLGTLCTPSPLGTRRDVNNAPGFKAQTRVCDAFAVDADFDDDTSHNAPGASALK